MPPYLLLKVTNTHIHCGSSDNKANTVHLKCVCLFVCLSVYLPICLQCNCVAIVKFHSYKYIKTLNFSVTLKRTDVFRPSMSLFSADFAPIPHFCEVTSGFPASLSLLIQYFNSYLRPLICACANLSRCHLQF